MKNKISNQTWIEIHKVKEPSEAFKGVKWYQKWCKTGISVQRISKGQDTERKVFCRLSYSERKWWISEICRIKKRRTFIQKWKIFSTGSSSAREFDILMWWPTQQYLWTSSTISLDKFNNLLKTSSIFIWILLKTNNLWNFMSMNSQK